MDDLTFNYRSQLIKVFWHLDGIIVRLLKMGFEIGLEEEWHELNELSEDGETLPMTLAYLRTIDHDGGQCVVNMIDILYAARDRFAEMNQLGDEDLCLRGQEEDDYTESILGERGIQEEDVEFEEELEDDHYLDYWMRIMPCGFFMLYESIVILAHGTPPSNIAYDSFRANFFSGTVPLKSDDENVNYLMKELNRTLKKWGELICCI